MRELVSNYEPMSLRSNSPNNELLKRGCDTEWCECVYCDLRAGQCPTQPRFSTLSSKIEPATLARSNASIAFLERIRILTSKSPYNEHLKRGCDTERYECVYWALGAGQYPTYPKFSAMS